MAKSDKPNILIIWGDDIGYWNISPYSMGMMGYPTPKHRPDWGGRGDLHRLVRTTELHSRPRLLHHWSEPDPHWPDQSRHALRRDRITGGRPDHS